MFSRNIILVAGGPYPSGDWRRTLKMGVDIAVVGEGEKSFPELLAKIYSGERFEHIKGVAFKKGSEIIFTGCSERVENLDLYPPFSEKYGLFSAIEITRGCPRGCNYCQTSYLFGRQMRHRSIENILMWGKVFKCRGHYDIRFISPDALSYGSDGKNPGLDIIAEMLKAVNGVIEKKHIFFGKVFLKNFFSKILLL